MTNARLVIVAALASVLVSAPILVGQAPPVVKACSLLPKADVKKLVGATDAFDGVEPKEAPTKSGSSCSYAGVYVQVGASTGPMKGMDGVPGMEAIPDLGEQAYLYNNPAGSVEISIKAGSRQLVVSRLVEAPGNFTSVRPGLLALAKALVAKLQ